MIHFEHPYLLILLLLPLILYWFFGNSETAKEEAPIITTPNYNKLVEAFAKNTGSSKVKSKFNYVMFLVWILFVTALMQPHTENKLKKIITSGYDIMLAVDLSGSMRALDFASTASSWNRLDVVKSVASKFIVGREGDRVGLILFGDDAYLQSPLSLDLNSVKEMLSMSEIGLAGDATAIGDSITLGVKNLRERPAGSRVLILLTDGDDTASKVPPLEAARLARDYGIKIYAIGVGKKGPVPYPTPGGQIIYTTLQINDDLLKEVANITSGKFYHATNKDALEEVYKEINQLEKTEAETKELILKNQLFQYPLGLAVLILVLMFLNKFRWGRIIGL